MPEFVNTVSKTAVNFASRSRITWRNPCARSSKSISRSRACRATHAPARMGGDPHQVHETLLYPDDEQHIQPSQTDGLHHEEARRQQTTNLRPQEPAPRQAAPPRCQTKTAAPQDPPHRGSPDADAQATATPPRSSDNPTRDSPAPAPPPAQRPARPHHAGHHQSSDRPTTARSTLNASAATSKAGPGRPTTAAAAAASPAQPAGSDPPAGTDGVIPSGAAPPTDTEVPRSAPRPHPASAPTPARPEHAERS
jgi:hypothetical protein